jgi:hypothetical protein
MKKLTQLLAILALAELVLLYVLVFGGQRVTGWLITWRAVTDGRRLKAKLLSRIGVAPLAKIVPGNLGGTATQSKETQP